MQTDSSHAASRLARSCSRSNSFTGRLRRLTSRRVSNNANIKAKVFDNVGVELVGLCLFGHIGRLGRTSREEVGVTLDRSILDLGDIIGAEVRANGGDGATVHGAAEEAGEPGPEALSLAERDAAVSNKDNGFALKRGGKLVLLDDDDARAAADVDACARVDGDLGRQVARLGAAGVISNLEVDKGDNVGDEVTLAMVLRQQLKGLLKVLLVLEQRLELFAGRVHVPHARHRGLVAVSLLVVQLAYRLEDVVDGSLDVAVLDLGLPELDVAHLHGSRVQVGEDILGAGL